MKKLFAILMIAAVMLSLAGCAQSSTTETPTTVQHDLSYYTKDFIGLQEYLVDYNLVSYVDMAKVKTATASEATASEASSDVRTPLFYDILGADNGVRFYISSSVFIEIYDFSKANNDTAKKVLADIKDDGKITLFDDRDEMTGVISKSGNYVILYNASNEYEYDKITKVLENW